MNKISYFQRLPGYLGSKSLRSFKWPSLIPKPGMFCRNRRGLGELRLSYLKLHHAVLSWPTPSRIRRQHQRSFSFAFVDIPLLRSRLQWYLKVRQSSWYRLGTGPLWRYRSCLHDCAGDMDHSLNTWFCFEVKSTCLDICQYCTVPYLLHCTVNG